ncbi:MAG: hypothetical protein LW650_12700 [Planctomycetaceae bacterium]|nr:hypothetical protein [Planctomycetaceae bacterium]
MSPSPANPPAPVPASGANPRPRRAGRRVLAAMLLTLAVLLTVAGLLWRAATSLPAWWAPPDASSDQVQRTGRAVEDGLSSLLTQPRSTDAPRWAMTLKQADAQAWLATRLQAWWMHRTDADRWPKAVRAVQVHFRPGEVELCVALSGAAVESVSLLLSPRVDEAGALWLTATGARVGRLPVPLGAVLGSDSTLRGPLAGLLGVTSGRPPELASALAGLGGSEPVAAPARMLLPDGRRVTLEGVQALEGRLDLTLRTGEAE